MGSALLSGVSGLKVHQQMLDVAGNNLANTNTTAYKATRITFTDMLAETLSDASAPTESTGGTNPKQLGTGVAIGAIDRNMSQGTLGQTGNPLDIAIEGGGFFTVSDGTGELYTRNGQFSVDSDNYLVDSVTGNRVQRIRAGIEFQDPADTDIVIPYNSALPAQETTQIDYSGNLSADTLEPSINIADADVGFTLAADGSDAASTDDLALLTGSTLVNGSTIVFTGTDIDGSAAGNTFTYGAANDGTTVQDLMDHMEAGFASGGVEVKLINSKLRIEDSTAGYSQTYIDSITSGNFAAANLPTSFEILTAGGEFEKQMTMELYDPQGNNYSLAGSFVRTDTTNQWDFVVKSISGGATVVDRRANGISFNTDGSYAGMDSVIGDDASFIVEYPSDPGTNYTISFNLGTPGELDGITQFGGKSTAVSHGQNGYAAGWLSTLSVEKNGTISGIFTNGQRRDIAVLRISTFQNPMGLEALGKNYYQTSSNSGNPIPTRAGEGGAGICHGGSLEQSNVDTAEQFVNLIRAQNGYQASARTITVANNMLKELTNIIR